MAVDAGLAMRIVRAVRGLQLAIDSITTFADRYLPATAEAAMALDLSLLQLSGVYTPTVVGLLQLSDVSTAKALGH